MHNSAETSKSCFFIVFYYYLLFLLYVYIHMYISLAFCIDRAEKYHS